MSNIVDYVLWRGDIDFHASPFNEVDNLILSTLTYMQMEKLVPSLEKGGKISLYDYYIAYKKSDYLEENLPVEPLTLLEILTQSKRFKDVFMFGFENEIDLEKQMQFASVSYLLPDSTIYVSYRGTDKTIVGWREDFNISYQDQTPGQNMAVHYLEKIMKEYPNPIRIGGHSKGGNFAVYAAIFNQIPDKDRILHVYSNDGPGFNDKVVKKIKECPILDRIQLILPESSIVGILMNNSSNQKIIQSAAKGRFQHDPLTWQVLASSFVVANELSSSSVILHKIMTRLLHQINEDQRANFVSTIFDALDQAGVTNTEQLQENKLLVFNAIINATKYIDEERQNDIRSTLRKLASISRDLLWDKAKERFSLRD